MCARSAKKFLFHRIAEKKWLQGDGLFFLKKPEFCGPNAPQILQLCKALQSKASNYQMCARRAQKNSFHHIAEKKRLQGDCFFSLEKPEVCAPKFRSCAKHCNLKHPVTKYAPAAHNFFSSHGRKKLIVR